MGKKFTVEIGDKVAYSVQFLRSIGMSHTDMGRARGIVTEVAPIGKGCSLILARINWQGGDMPERVNVQNLAKVGSNSRFAAM